MQNLQDIQEKIFFEAKTALESLSKINSIDELLAKQDLFSEVRDRIAFLRILEKNSSSFVVEEASQIIDNQHLNQNNENLVIATIHETDNENLFEEDVIEEEVIFNNELNEIDDEEVAVQPVSEIANEESFTAEEPAKVENVEDQEQKIEDIYSSEYKEMVAQKEREFLELEERRRKIVDFSKEEVAHLPKAEVFEQEKAPSHHSEKRFKLAHIKGLKAVQNLFDDDPLKEIEEEKTSAPDSGSLLKTNIPTDFMEAEKKKPEFRIDLNDKVAFTKLLFNGDADELKRTIDQLNSYDNLDDAKQYLSDIYYQRNWEKVDEYAQRLWSLVENKFL